jgi:polyisoprenyl-teichoic acid--peptidoglycan teichoic acid transferase
MAPEEKPYRVYKGGRVKGKVPAPSGAAAKRAKAGGESRYRGPGAVRRGPGGRFAFLRRVDWRRWVPIGLGVLAALCVVWAAASYISMSSGVSDANKRLPADARAELTHQGGLLISHSTTILVLGTDNAPIADRAGDDHSDSIMLVRTDPAHHRIAYLSIPRDLEVPIVGVGTAKINAAMQAGGPKLAISTVREFIGIPINHVIVVNFAEFRGLIDALGGITVDVPDAVLSNRFDCPFATAAACERWPGWRFAKGPQHMSGERALVYSRIRENLLNPRESSDFFRTSRQQAVTQAVLSKFTSIGTLFSLPFDGSGLVKPIATDLSTMQLIELGWVKFRSSSGSALHCRLGGDFGPGGNGEPDEDNALTVAAFLGKSAPQLPTSTFGPGCAVGHDLS